MGSWLSKKSVLQINDKKLTMKEFHDIKTFKDVMQIAGYNVDDLTTIQVVNSNGKYEYLNACETFKIVQSIRYNQQSIYIAKLYGKN